MGDGDFQHFLKVLEEVEAVDPPQTQEETKLEMIAEKWSAILSLPSSEKILPIWDIKAVNSSSKARKYSLRRPGFIYRTKDLTRTTYLDSNLWEFTACGKRILRSPSFKYRHKRKLAISPYSTKVLENFGRLTLSAKSTTPILSCPNKVPQIQPQRKESTFGDIQFLPLEKSHIQFLPLEKSPGNTSNPTHCIVKKKRVKPVISPAKLKRTVSTKIVKNSVEKPDAKSIESGSFGCPPGAVENSSFGSLSAQTEPLVVRKFASTSFDNFRDSANLGNSHRASNDVLAACKDGNDLDAEKSEPCSNSPKRLIPGIERSCSFQARMCEQDMPMSVDEMSIYMEDILFLPQKMSKMAEMMYT